MKSFKPILYKPVRADDGNWKYATPTGESDPFPTRFSALIASATEERNAALKKEVTRRPLDTVACKDG